MMKTWISHSLTAHLLLYKLIRFLCLCQTKFKHPGVNFSSMPEAREMPLYKLINDPLATVMGVENVNRNVKPVLAKAGNGRF